MEVRGQLTSQRIAMPDPAEDFQCCFAQNKTIHRSQQDFDQNILFSLPRHYAYKTHVH